MPARRRLPAVAAPAADLPARAPTATGPEPPPSLRPGRGRTLRRHLHLGATALALGLALYAAAGELPPLAPTTAMVPGRAAALPAAGDLPTRIVALEAEVRRLKQRQAIALLADMLAGQRPFEDELAAAIVAADGDQELLAELDHLVPLASKGVPTREGLLRALPPLIAGLRAESRRPGLVGGATILMRDLAVGLGVGQLPDGGVESLLRQAEAASGLDRLELAAARLRQLPAAAAGGRAAAWLDGLAARERAERALDRLRSLVMQGTLGDGSA